jgi:hypothetical protein
VRRDDRSKQTPVGRDFNVREPTGTPTMSFHGGEITEWEAIEKIEKLTMRRGITKVVLASLPLLVVGGVVGGILGMQAYIVAALGFVVAGALVPVLRYYF